MLFHLVVGALAMLGFVLLQNYVQKSGKTIVWWQWLLTVLGFLYTVLVLEVIYGFAAEGAGQAALVMGLITGLVAVVWGILLGRFVFARAE